MGKYVSGKAKMKSASYRQSDKGRTTRQSSASQPVVRARRSAARRVKRNLKTGV